MRILLSGLHFKPSIRLGAVIEYKNFKEIEFNSPFPSKSILYFAFAFAKLKK